MTTDTLSIGDIREMLANRRKITIAWYIDDVLAVRPDLSEDAAWIVLQICEREHNPKVGLSWSVIRDVAESMFPSDDECD